MHYSHQISKTPRITMKTLHTMKHLFAIILGILFFNSAQAQISTSMVVISKTYSQNGKYYIKSIPYSNEQPTLRGKSFVYESNSNKLVCSIDRYFYYDGEDNNFLCLSNDGQTIAYILCNYENDKTDATKCVTIYQKGVLKKSYTLTEITGIDTDKETVKLRYYNNDVVVDRNKSKVGTKDYKKVFKDDVSEKELFLNQWPLFSNKDTIYLTDSKGKVHILDISLKNPITTIAFDNIYSRLKTITHKNLCEVENIETPYPKNNFFPDMADGRTTGLALGDFLGLKAVKVGDPDVVKYTSWRIDLMVYIDRNGNLEIENLKVESPLPYDKIKTFFKTNLFDASFLPKELDKWYIPYFFWKYRNKSDSIAALDTKEIKRKQDLEREHRKIQDTINGVYIPKNMEECLLQLDKVLNEVSKNEIKGLSNEGEMSRYHFGLGMWIRNNWGLWGGSRLQVYFNNYGITVPDSMSGIILSFYFYWTHGRKEAGKEWEAARKKSMEENKKNGIPEINF